MNLTTRERLLRAATTLFADSGYRGASVRDICNLAGANPGAVSYHFGGKRQLYRAVLRRAVAGLAGIAAQQTSETADGRVEMRPDEAVLHVLRRLEGNDEPARLLLRDLADGGAVAVEALTPVLRGAFERLSAALGEGDSPRGSARGRLLFLSLAAPLFLLTAGWPVAAAVLELDPGRRTSLLEELVRRALAEHLRSEATVAG